MEVIQAEVARLINVTRMAITKAVRSGSLKLTDNGKIDTDDPVNFAYLDKKGLFNNSKSDKKQESPVKTVKKTKEFLSKKKTQLDNVKPAKPEIKKQLEGMTIEDLYNDDLWTGKPLNLVKEREKVLAERERRKKIEIANAHARGQLVDRKLVSSLVFNYLNILGERLFDMCDSVNTELRCICETENDDFQKDLKIQQNLSKKVSKLIIETKKIITDNLEKMEVNSF